MRRAVSVLVSAAILGSVRATSFPHPLVNGSLVAAVFTAMDPSGLTLDLSGVPAYASFLCESGVPWVFVGGTTGESLSLTIDERQRLAEAWVAASRDSCIRIIVHVGAESIVDARALAAHAARIGAHGIASMPPVFFKPSSVANLVAWLAPVAAAAPSLPFYYYHIPSMTGVAFKMADFLPAAAAAIPTLNGVKFSDTDLYDFSLTVQAMNESYEILFGSDQQMESAAVFGAAGFVGSTYNYAGRLYNRLLADLRAGNMTAALAEQRRSQAFVRVMFKYSSSNVNGNKAIAQLRTGVPMGGSRPPLATLTDTSALHSDLDAIGFFTWS